MKVDQIELVSGQQQTEIREELLLEILEIHQVLEFAAKEVGGWEGVSQVGSGFNLVPDSPPPFPPLAGLGGGAGERAVWRRLQGGWSGGKLSLEPHFRYVPWLEDGCGEEEGEK